QRLVSAFLGRPRQDLWPRNGPSGEWRALRLHVVHAIGGRCEPVWQRRPEQIPRSAAWLRGLRRRAMKRRMQPRSARRPGFTLLELLVVIGLIAVLVALTAGTILMVLNTRIKTNTEQAVRNIYESLDLHLRAVIDQADGPLPIPQSVWAIAGGDAKRAKVIWRKLQIKRNFPMTFYEALSPATYTGNTALPAPARSLLWQLSH